MAYEARVLKDSITERGDRLTTLEVIFPRFVLAEFNTHRMLSRNTASSRAIPTIKQLRKNIEEPFMPEYWGINQAGMQAEEQLSDDESGEAEAVWMRARGFALLGSVALSGGPEEIKDDELRRYIEDLDEELRFDLKKYSLKTPVHKQLANRVIEPFMWHTALVTATDWDNFMALRAHPNAQPEIRMTAYKMKQALGESEPNLVQEGEYHLPLTREEDMALPIDKLIKIAVGRCARVSYLTHEGRRDPEKDVELYEQLLRDGHMSPMEHVATPMTADQYAANPYLGNIRGWVQHRKTIPNENNFAKVVKS